MTSQSTSFTAHAHSAPSSKPNNSTASSTKPSSVEPLHHPGQTALVSKTNQLAHAPGQSEMGGKALLAKKMAASGQSFYSPTDTMVSPCTAKLHLAKKKHFNKGKPVALSSSFATSQTNPLNPHPQKLPFQSQGFLHPSHAHHAQHALAQQGAPSKESDEDDEDEEMEM